MPMHEKKLVIMGFGGHARSVADVALACGYGALLFVDTNAVPDENFLGHPVKHHLQGLDETWRDAIAASGNNQQRRIQYQHIAQMGMHPVSIISPLASIGMGSVISPGCFVGYHAHIGPMASIGHACIINTGAIVEHEARIGDYSHVSINASIAGRCSLGSFSMLGAGATVIDGLSVADEVTIGAGAVVIDSISQSGTYVGVPACRVP